MGGSSAPSNTTTTNMDDPRTAKAKEEVRQMIRDYIAYQDEGSVNRRIADAQTQIAEDQKNIKKYDDYVAKGGKLNPEQQARYKGWQNGISEIQDNIGFANEQLGTITKQKSLNADQNTALEDQKGNLNSLLGQAKSVALDLSSGKYDTNFAPVDNVDFAKSDASLAKAAGAAKSTSAEAGGAGYTDAKLAQLQDYQAAIAQASSPYQSAVAQTSSPYQSAGISESDLTQARQALGSLDPTSSLQQLLTGKIDNPYLQGINQANINQSMQGYGDMLQNLNQQVMPGINSDAFAAGQYGGSRQGIAQGLALQQAERNARDLTQSNADQGTKLYGQAYQNAQQNMLSTASELNNQAGQNAQFNVGQANQIGLQNAQNAMTNNQYDTSQLNDMSKFNAGNQLALNQFDTTQYNNMAQFNAGNQLQNQQLAYQGENALNLANAAGASQASVAAGQMATQAGIANANNATQTSQFNTGQLNEISSLNAQLATANNQLNANNMIDVGKSNANLGLQNNEQQIGQIGQNLGNQVNALNIGNTANSAYNSGLTSIYGDQTALNNYENTKAQNNIQLAAQGAQIGGGGVNVTSGGGGSNLLNLTGQVGGTLAAGIGAYNLIGRPLA
jgi:hypothetical protein